MSRRCTHTHTHTHRVTSTHVLTPTSPCARTRTVQILCTHSHAHVRMYILYYARTYTPLLLRIGRMEPWTSTSGPPSRNTISKEQSTSRQRLLTIPSHKEDKKLGGTAWTNQLVPARLEGIFSSVAPGNMISKHLWSWS